MKIGYDGESYDEKDARQLRRSLGLPEPAPQPVDEDVPPVRGNVKGRKIGFGTSPTHPHRQKK